jgi:hypothetical protein
MAEPDEDTLRREDAERVRRALGFVKPAPLRREECREAVDIALINLDYGISQRHAAEHRHTKAAKTAVDRLAAALRRVDVALKSKDLEEYTRLQFASIAADWQYWLERHKSKVPSGTLTRMDAERKRRAISAAHVLMKKYGADGAAEDTRKSSDFCKLAALIFGKPTADLSNQCKAFCRKRRVSK